MACGKKRVNSQMFMRPLGVIDGRTEINIYLFEYHVPATKTRPEFNANWRMEFKPRPPTEYQQNQINAYNAQFEANQAEHEQMIQEFNDKLAEFNDRVEEFNATIGNDLQTQINNTYSISENIVTKKTRITKRLDAAQVNRRLKFFKRAGLKVRQFYDRLYIYQYTQKESASDRARESLLKASLELVALTEQGH